ncbi:hypothetical protein [Bordetella sp. BOR01]|uniref:hypothetical protein n=1 Tax=Bordetella sp. BOR01 TaxID=2854779 RepID=UPI001C4858C2|nr:hypothetical protein [Bordetella sp. BOR01]MBV7484310.1 hypothetical protein [Bordetella sp. BOR01]
MDTQALATLLWLNRAAGMVWVSFGVALLLRKAAKPGAGAAGRAWAQARTKTRLLLVGG